MSSKLWGGRFEMKKMDPDVLAFTSSVGVDHVLAAHDCFASKVHAETLEKAGYISSSEKKAITSALDSFMKDMKKGKINLSEYEDIHSAVQAHVEAKAPSASKKMHTARSRNEQVVNDVRLYCKENIERLGKLIRDLQKALINKAESLSDVVIPGYTHLNRAQPVLFSHLLMAYVEMLERDSGRLLDAGERLDVSVMGSGAIAGSSLALDRAFMARKLGFKGVSANSIDSVSDRDFMFEILSAIAMTGVHLSRISEDFILYGTSEFGFLSIGEAYCTGSSLMPQKKNADVLELVRARASRLIGVLPSFLSLLKGLPHAYNRDLQEDKEYLFSSVEDISAALSVMAGLVKTVKIDAKEALAKLKDEFIYATDMAEYLVRSGVAFKDAHRIVGNIIKYCVGRKTNISGLSMKEMQAFAPEFGEDIFSFLEPLKSVRMKKTAGSTNPDMVRREIKRWKKIVG